MHRFCKNRYFFTISVPIAGFPPEPMIGSAAELPQYLDVTWAGAEILPGLEFCQSRGRGQVWPKITGLGFTKKFKLRFLFILRS